MFLSLIRKQITILLRSPSEMLILLFMPIVLITILSFALGALWEGENEVSKVELAIVQQDDEIQQLDQFLHEAKGSMNITSDMEKNLQQLLPISILLQQIEGNEEMKQFIHLTELQPEKLEDAKESGEYSAILEVPKDFTFNFLSSIYLQGEKPTFNVYLNESEKITSTIVQSILDYYQQQYSLVSSLAQNGVPMNMDALPKMEIASDTRTVDSQTEITSSTYYTFSMTVMFILYIASTLASQAFVEKYFHIFDRVLLARIHPLTYLLSIMTATIILAIVQVGLLFTFAHFVFHISFTQWELFVVMTLLLSIVVGGLAALLSSINYRTNSGEASNVFSNAFVSVFALVGGSYFNISSLSPWLAELGMWTPNGAALNGYLKIYQNATLMEIMPNIIHLAILAVLFTVLAVVLFPKRGGIV
ncbi:ABC transporter permease [Ureibacillus sp. Re31]|uniref:ABC transporter permease n=1 Tax=Ureibacillus galli TaxID=2762222 RepID=A0ABR8XES8_9BACL|nr:ABC transporter permease [Ureibacillus galli]MBD8027746.1 ABC transporter permease [Ureibacillus galli]